MNKQKADERDCAVFMDLYPDYSECEEGTREWMDEHKSNCAECKKWSEEPVKEEAAPKDLQPETFEPPSEDKRIIQTVRLLFAFGIGFIAVYSIWLSIWMFL